MANPSLTMQSLESQTGVAARTLRSWIRRRVLPKPVGRARAARYDEGHVLRARVIEGLRSQGLSIAAIRTRLAGLSSAELQTLLPRPKGSELAPPPPPPAPTYPFHTWEMVQLMPGMALMVNAQGAPGLKRIADEIYRHYHVPPQPSVASAGAR